MAVIPHVAGHVFAQPVQTFVNTSSKGPIFGSEFNEMRSSFDPAKAFSNYFGRVHKEYKVDTSKIEALANRLLQEQDPTFMDFVRKETLLRDTFLQRVFKGKTSLGEVLQALQDSQESPNRKLLSKKTFNEAEKEAGELTRKEVALTTEKGQGKEDSSEAFSILKKQAAGVGSDLVSELSLCPQLVGNYSSTAEFYNALHVQGNYAYATTYSGLEIIDLTDKAKPKLAGFYKIDDPGLSMGLGVDTVGNNTYVAENFFGLRIINVSNVAKPILAGSYKVWSFTNKNISRNVVVYGNYAYMICSSGLLIFDVSDVANPKLVGSYDMVDPGGPIAVDKYYAYVVGKSSLQILDLTDKANPKLVSSYYVSGIMDLAVSYDGYAYVLSNGKFSGLTIFNVRNMAIPKIISSISINFPKKIAILGNYVYVTTSYYVNFQIFDVSNVHNPMLVGYIDGVWAAGETGISIWGNYAFVVNSDTFRSIDWKVSCLAASSSTDFSCSSALQWMGFKV